MTPAEPPRSGYSMREYARMSRLSYSTVRELCATGEIPTHRWPGRRIVRIPAWFVDQSIRNPHTAA